MITKEETKKEFDQEDITERVGDQGEYIDVRMGFGVYIMLSVETQKVSIEIGSKRTEAKGVKTIEDFKQLAKLIKGENI